MYSLIIVDDEPEILAGLCSMLRWNDLGFELKAAFTNGEDARKWISTHTCDVVFCDIVMGDFSGLDLADWLRVNYPKTYVMLNSAYEGIPLCTARYRGPSIPLYPQAYQHRKTGSGLRRSQTRIGSGAFPCSP